ncbi:hypothetical protein CN103_34925, partial [Sinorhizobium meliloti]
GVQALLNKYVAKAREHCVSLRKKRVSPHVLRHSRRSGKEVRYSVGAPTARGWDGCFSARSIAQRSSS